jgi:hypothetical protein
VTAINADASITSVVVIWTDKDGNVRSTNSYAEAR